MSDKKADTTPSAASAPAGKRVDGTFADPWKPTKVGDIFVGTFLGSQKAEGKRGQFEVFHFKTPNGQRMSVTGASLNTVMAQIPRKTECTITYNGTKETNNGEMKLFDVSVPPGTVLIDPYDSDD